MNTTTVEGKQYAVEIIDDKHVSIDGKVYTIDFESVSGQPVYSLIVDGKSHEAYVQPGDEAWQVLLRGRLYPVQVEDEREKRLRAAANTAASGSEAAGVNGGAGLCGFDNARAGRPSASPAAVAASDWPRNRRRDWRMATSATRR